MTTSRRTHIVAGIAAVTALAVATAVLVKVIHAANAEPEYPDAPFRPVGKDFPRIIPVTERPTRAEFDVVRRLLTQTGAIRNATAEEQAAVKVLYQPGGSRDGRPNYIRARELAEKILESNPNSVPALYTLAQAHFRSERNLPQALFHVRQARKLLEKRGRANPDDEDAREWYLRALLVEYDILRAMDRAEEQLRVVELMEQIYEPLPWMKVWALFKVKRLQEARKALEEAERTGRWRLSCLNSRCALEEQSRNREATYQAGKVMVKELPYSPVLWSNYGLACMYTFRPDEAERAYLTSVSKGRPDFYGTAYRPLALLYLQQGRVPEALSALKKGRAQRALRAPHTLQQDQRKIEQATGLLLLALGHNEEAERFLRRAYDDPDRTGSTTDDETDLLMVNGLLLWTVLGSELEQLREEDAGVSGVARLAPDLKRKALEFQVWTLRRQLLKILHAPDRLSAIRPYMPGNVEIEAWLAPGLLRILPPGVAAEALRQARAEEDHPGAVPYFDAFEAEVALLRGDAEAALALARKALDRLPAAGEKLLRARASAVAGAAARRLGKRADGLALLQQALRDFPQAFRLLGTAIPVKVEHDGSAPASDLAARLLRSPRFAEAPDGFRVVIRTEGGKLMVEMFRAAGERHCQVSVALSGKADAVADTLKELHRKVMSPALDLSQVDINSLDGSPSTLQL
jgi:tetratricopeptide (TPR) repeat protein